MTGEGNVADTGIKQEAENLIKDGEAKNICEALEILMAEARTKKDKEKMSKIKPTQKYYGCRRSRKKN